MNLDTNFTKQPEGDEGMIFWVGDHMKPAGFSYGDLIEITSVRRIPQQIIAQDHYHLCST